MNKLDLIRYYNQNLYELSLRLYDAELSALPNAIAYDDIGGSHGGQVNQIEQAFLRADNVSSKIIKITMRRNQLAEMVKRAAYKSDITEQEWFTVKMFYIVTKDSGKPYKWQEVSKEAKRIYHVKDRQAYNYRLSGCKKILQKLEKMT